MNDYLIEQMAEEVAPIIYRQPFPALSVKAKLDCRLAAVACLAVVQPMLKDAEQDKDQAMLWRHWLEYIKHDTVAAQALVWKAENSRTKFRKLLRATIPITAAPAGEVEANG